jgi:uncharacterized protein (DUF1684 family)
MDVRLELSMDVRDAPGQMNKRCCLALLAAVLGVACGRSDQPASLSTTLVDAAYGAEVEQYRRSLETKLRSDTGWLTIAGLEFLIRPETTFGSDRSNDIVLPATAPARVGTFILAKDGSVSVTLARGVQVRLLDGRPFTGGPIAGDGTGPPDRLVLGDVQVWVHQSGDRPAIRIRDKNNPLRATFTGMKWYPVDTAYRVEATFEPYDTPKALKVPNLLGDVDTMVAPGEVVFTLGGASQRLVAVEDGDELWFIFRDLTSGDTTYEAARFLYAPLPSGGKVVLDFNRAENPPCAFNPHTTCPLPPPQNRMKIRVEAGEQLPQRP